MASVNNKYIVDGKFVKEIKRMNADSGKSVGINKMESQWFNININRCVVSMVI